MADFTATTFPRRYGWILVRTADNHIEHFSFVKHEIKQTLLYHPQAAEYHIERARVASMVRRDLFALTKTEEPPHATQEG